MSTRTEATMDDETDALEFLAAARLEMDEMAREAETAALVAQMRETGRVAVGVNMVVYTGSLGRVWIRDGRELVSVNREQRHQLAAILAWDSKEVQGE